MRSASRFALLLGPAFLALLLALRLLSPVGFMPSFEHASLAIVLCDDGSGTTASPHQMHHGGGKKADHPPCPYAAAASVASLDHDLGQFLAVVIVAAIVLMGRSFEWIERRDVGKRPPTRAPPIPA
ncbi:MULTISPECIES: hypothetical protein [Sphingomonas]|uniref:hypothetical protein n=1 Tax=Sphingomonas TaxID=13687 RepID=UPI001269C229|nr:MULTISPECIES: hypothetical protein [Sphingomonas]